MKRIFATAILCLEFATAQTITPECAAFQDKNKYYFQEDGLALYSGQVILNPYNLSTEEQQYLRRFVNILKKNGTEIVMLPTTRAGFTLAGKLDSSRIKGTIFEVTDRPDYEQLMHTNYLRRLNTLSDIGIITVDYMGAVQKHLAQGSSKPVYFPQDDHWTPEGARIAAYSLKETLRNKRPELLQSLNTLKFSIAQGKTVVYSEAGIPGLIRRACPEVSFVSKIQSFSSPVANLESKIGLMDDTEPPILLFGSSFSNPIFGFGEYLKESLGSDIQQQFMPNGGVFGAAREYFTVGENPKRVPTLIVWEFPDNYAFSSLEFRQLFPIIENSKIVESKTLSLKDPITEVKFSREFEGPGYFIRITPSGWLTRSINVQIGKGTTSEKITLSKMTGTAPKDFNIELRPAQSLTTFSIDSQTGTPGTVKIELRQYID